MSTEEERKYSKILERMDYEKRLLFSQDGRGRTLLFYAAERGQMEKVREIIFSLAGTGVSPARLALITMKDKSGHTAADLAAQNGNHEIEQLLRGEQGRMEYFE